jgi:hypothetical protein
MQPNQAPAGAALRLLGLAITLLLAAPAFAQDPMFVKSLPAHAPLTITLHDDIASPIYTWPRTLLTYPVDFSARKIKVTELQLTADGQPIPFQLSDIKTAPDATLTFAKLSFFSTLTPGATHTFSLDPPPPPPAGGPPPPRDGAELCPYLPATTSFRLHGFKGSSMFLRNGSIR